MRSELGIDPIAIDVGRLLQHSVASLYSHLVTRPTGRAVRLAIEAQLSATSRTSLSMIDLSEVAVIDFSCADEVVAKLLMRFLQEDRPGDALFVFRGLDVGHHEPIEAVLERQTLLMVTEGSDGQCGLLGTRSDEEQHVWSVLESRGRIDTKEVAVVFPSELHRQVLDELVRRRVVFASPDAGGYHALSTLLRDAHA